MFTLHHLKSASLASLFAALCFMGVAFYTMHLHPIKTLSHLVTYRTAPTALGLASISWSGHITHVSIPINKLLSSGVEPLLISPNPIGVGSTPTARAW